MDEDKVLAAIEALSQKMDSRFETLEQRLTEQERRSKKRPKQPARSQRYSASRVQTSSASSRLYTPSPSKNPCAAGNARPRSRFRKKQPMQILSGTVLIAAKLHGFWMKRA